MPRKEPAGGQTSAQAQQEAISEGIDSFELPRSLVTRIARSAFPDNVKLQKETVTALLKGSTVFVNYLAATAHDVAASKQHKSVSASDVLKALELTQFGDLVDKLQGELQIYRELQKTDKGKKGGSRGKGKEVETASSTASKSKAKGKEKEVTGPSPSPPASRVQPPQQSAPGSGFDQNEDVDDEDERPVEEPDDEDMGDGEDEVVEDEDDEVDDGEDEAEADEGEEEEDQMVVEEEQLRRDAAGLEAADEDMED